MLCSSNRMTIPLTGGFDVSKGVSSRRTAARLVEKAIREFGEKLLKSAQGCLPSIACTNPDQSASEGTVPSLLVLSHDGPLFCRLTNTFFGSIPLTTSVGPE